jgi:hypothetical protein
MSNVGAIRKQREPTVAELRELFSYDHGTGLLTWNRRHGDHPGVAIFNASHAGKVAGSPHCKGYLQVAFVIDGKKYAALVHRVCFALHYGYYPDLVDHKDGNRKNNRAKNLRDADASKNLCNRRKVVARSGLKGVYVHKCTGKFFSQVRFQGRYEYLGIHENEEDCARAYDAAVTRLHGEFARTNASLNLIGD